MGMIAQGVNTFAGMGCPINTYGAAGKVYGLTSAPCKPCPRNMITDGAVNVTNADVCINPGGFGYASEGASRCAPSFYAAKGSRKPCQQCPPGRTTADDLALQLFITHCVVKAGAGVVDSAINSTDAFNIDTTGFNDTQKVSLPVLECPVGYYGPGGALDSHCTACPAGSSTLNPGATSASDCSGACGGGQRVLGVGRPLLHGRRVCCACWPGCAPHGCTAAVPWQRQAAHTRAVEPVCGRCSLGSHER
jgi:hypothetical protein